MVAAEDLSSDQLAAVAGVEWTAAICLFASSVTLLYISLSQRGTRGQVWAKHFKDYPEQNNLSAFITLIACLNYFARALVRSTDMDGEVTMYLGQYADYLVTCPFLVLDLCWTAQISLKVTYAFVVFVVILCGFLATVFPSPVSYAWYAMGMFLFCVVLFFLFQELNRVLKKHQATPTEQHMITPLKVAMASFFGIWAFYPIVWLLSDNAFNVIGIVTNVTLHAVLDIAAKSCFGLSIMKYRQKKEDIELYEEDQKRVQKGLKELKKYRMSMDTGRTSFDGPAAPSPSVVASRAIKVFLLKSAKTPDSKYADIVNGDGVKVDIISGTDLLRPVVSASEKEDNASIDSSHDSVRQDWFAHMCKYDIMVIDGSLLQLPKHQAVLSDLRHTLRQSFARVVVAHFDSDIRQNTESSQDPSSKWTWVLSEAGKEQIGVDDFIFGQASSLTICEKFVSVARPGTPTNGHTVTSSSAGIASSTATTLRPPVGLNSVAEDFSNQDIEVSKHSRPGSPSSAFTGRQQSLEESAERVERVIRNLQAARQQQVPTSPRARALSGSSSPRAPSPTDFALNSARRLNQQASMTSGFGMA